MNEHIEAITETLEGFSTSAALAVADHLRTVARNGGELNTVAAAIGECEALTECALQARALLFLHLPKNEKPRPLTHAEAVDMFPILRGVRKGFDERGRLVIWEDFINTARPRGGGAMAATQILLSVLCGASCDFQLQLGRMDSEHRSAVVQLFAAVVERGTK